MPCKHSLQALLAKTQFAKDGPAMRRSKKAFAKHQIDAVNSVTQMITDSSRRVLQNSMEDINFVRQQHPPELEVPGLVKASDRGLLFDPIRELCREYAFYPYDHMDVYDAIVSLFGSRTFGPEAVPSDALAFVTLAAFTITVVNYTGLNTNASREIREKGTIAASMVSLNENFLKQKRDLFNRNAESSKLWRYVYDVLLVGNDKVSTLVTDIMWTLMSDLSGISEELHHTCTDSFSEYVAASKSISVSSADPLWFTARAEFVINGNTYEAAGYCRDGVILRKIRDGVDDGGSIFEFFGVFSRIEDHYNAKNDSSMCAGCKLQMLTENGRLHKYESSLCSADLKTSQDVKVYKDGSVEFKAETFLIDKKHGKVLRTKPRKHKCDLYDMHMLGGFDIKNSGILSCLFGVSEGEISRDVDCSEVSLWATVERMDDYELDDIGRVKAIRHGETTKFANQDGGRLLWGTISDGSAFTIDDLVEYALF